MTPDPDIAAEAYRLARALLEQLTGFPMQVEIRLTAGASEIPPSPEPQAPAPGKTAGGNLSAAPVGAGDAKAPPPADGPGNCPPHQWTDQAPWICQKCGLVIQAPGSGRESGDYPKPAGKTPLESAGVPATAADPALSVDEARAALEAAQDREDAARGSNVLTALQQGKLGAKAVKALGAKWPMPRGATFGSRDSSLIARLQKAGTIAVGKWCRIHDVKEG